MKKLEEEVSFLLPSLAFEGLTCNFNGICKITPWGRITIYKGVTWRSYPGLYYPSLVHRVLCWIQDLNIFKMSRKNMDLAFLEMMEIFNVRYSRLYYLLSRFYSKLIFRDY